MVTAMMKRGAWLNHFQFVIRLDSLDRKDVDLYDQCAKQFFQEHKDEIDHRMEHRLHNTELMEIEYYGHHMRFHVQFRYTKDDREFFEQRPSCPHCQYEDPGTWCMYCGWEFDEW